MKLPVKLAIIAGLAAAALSGCMTAADHSATLHSSAERELTVGTVQREIRRGMSQAAVVETLGSPNIVTQDGAGGETWVYDKIATEASYSNSTGSAAGLAGGANGGSTLLLGGLLGSYSASSGAAASSQKTLTVIIKFDKSGQVRDFSYHASKF